MKISRISVISGIKWAALVALALVFLPPLLVGFLPVWAEAKNLAERDKRLQEVCGPPATVSLSRWFYTYRFSGESGSAAFNGEIEGEKCQRQIRIALKKIDSTWQVSDIKIVP